MSSNADDEGKSSFASAAPSNVGSFGAPSGNQISANPGFGAPFGFGAPPSGFGELPKGFEPSFGAPGGFVGGFGTPFGGFGGFGSHGGGFGGFDAPVVPSGASAGFGAPAPVPFPDIGSAPPSGAHGSFGSFEAPARPPFEGRGVAGRAAVLIQLKSGRYIPPQPNNWVHETFSDIFKLISDYLPQKSFLAARLVCRSWFSLLPTLPHVFLSSNRLEDRDDAFYAAHLSSKVIFSRINEKSESTVVELLESASFQTVNFRSTSFYSASLDKIVPALSNSKTLTDLDMRACDIEMKGALVAEIVKKTTSIKKLNLYHNLMGDGFLPIAEALKTNSSIEELILLLNYLEEKHFSALAAALKVNTTLTKLDISENDASEAGISAFAAALPEMKSLLYLNISETKAKDKGVSSIAEALHGNKVLRTLKLHSVGLKEDGCIALADCLKRNSTLRKLDICGNYITAPALVALTTALIENQTLHSFKTDCKLADATPQLAQIIAEHKSLKSLYLGGDSKATPETISPLLSALDQSRLIKLSLRQVTLDGTNLVALGKVIAKSSLLRRFWAFASTASEDDVREFFKRLSERESPNLVDVLLFQKIKNEEAWNLARKMATGTAIRFICLADRFESMDG